MLSSAFLPSLLIQIQGPKQNNGDDECASVKLMRETTNKHSAECPFMPVCESLDAKHCTAVFPKKTAEDCARENGKESCLEDCKSSDTDHAS